MPAKRPRADLVFAGLALSLALGLQAVAIQRQSLISDAPYHLLAGHQALRYGQNTLNLEHPPLIKLLSSLPLLASEDALGPPLEAREGLANSGRIFDRPEIAHRARIAGRTILLIFVALPLLGACFALGRELSGWRSGILLCLAMGLSSSVLPFLSVIQTDAAATLGFVLVVVGGLRFTRAPGLSRAAFLGLGLGIAIASKFSGVLAAPAAMVALALPRGISWRRRFASLALTAVVALSVAWSTYFIANLSYDSALGRMTISQYCRGEASLLVGDEMRPLEEALLTVEKVSPTLAQWLTGLLGIRTQDSIGVYPAYAFGEVSSKGTWWYFPALFLIRTPIALLVVTALALTVAARSRAYVLARPNPETIVILSAVLTYAAAAITSNYNLGIRHLMPVMPFLFIPGVLWAARTRARWWILSAVLIVEALLLAPLWMSATNTWWLGGRNPTRSAVFSLEYHQNLLLLRDSLDRLKIEEVHVAFPALSREELHAYLPRAMLVAPGQALEPGWYALGLRARQYVPTLVATSDNALHGRAALQRFARAWEPTVREIEQGENFGAIAGTFHLYRLRQAGESP